jgi:thymidine kinase
MAKLHFKYGAMNCGKSAELINNAYNYTEQGLTIATIKPSVDTKGNRFIVTRGGASREVDILATPEEHLGESLGSLMARRALTTLDCVLVDEAQFLQPKQVDQLYEVAKTDEISVIAFGLRTDFLSQLFPGSQRLLELADNIEKIPTMCRCGSQAEFNCRKVNGLYVFSGNQVAIDGQGAVTYDSLCGGCYTQQKSFV